MSFERNMNDVSEIMGVGAFACSLLLQATRATVYMPSLPKRRGGSDSSNGGTGTKSREARHRR